MTAELARNAEGANKPHYHVLEIFLPVDNPELDAKVKKDAEEVEKQLHQGAPFPVVARQFSQHPSAATGGVLIDSMPLYMTNMCAAIGVTPSLTSAGASSVAVRISTAPRAVAAASRSPNSSQPQRAAKGTWA